LGHERKGSFQRLYYRYSCPDYPRLPKPVLRTNFPLPHPGTPHQRKTDCHIRARRQQLPAGDWAGGKRFELPGTLGARPKRTPGSLFGGVFFRLRLNLDFKGGHLPCCGWSNWTREVVVSRLGTVCAKTHPLSPLILLPCDMAPPLCVNLHGDGPIRG